MSRTFTLTRQGMNAAMRRLDPPFCITCQSRGEPDKIYIGQLIVTKTYRTGSSSVYKTMRRHATCAKEVNII